MSQPFRSLALACAAAGLLAACQPQAKPKALASAQPGVAASSQSAPGAQPPVATQAGPDKAAEDPTKVEIGPAVPNVLAFLTANNLAPLWQADFGQQGNDPYRPTILDGFYGSEHRHISVIFERVQRDAAHPNIFQVQGRTRYKKNITPFSGTITVEGIRNMKAFLDLDSADAAQARAYTATARFVLREDAATAGAGTYQGTALMDFFRMPSGKLEFVQEMPVSELPTGGGGLLFRGQWQSQRTSQRQPVAFATYAQAVLPDALADLYIGERGETLNPKYAGLDWSEAWENDEWWAKSPKPSLSL